MPTPHRKAFEFMVKNLFRRLFAALGVAGLLTAAPVAAEIPQTARPALWQVSDADTTIYLFGTIHLLPEHLQWRTAKFNQALDSSQQLVVETIVDQQHPEAIQSAELSLGFSKGLPPIADRVAPDKVARLRAAIAKTGIPEKMYDQMDTWLAAIQLLGVQFRSMGLKGSDGPEEILRQQFLSQQKPIGELETNVEQFGYFDRLPEKAQRSLLEGALDQPSGMDDEYKGMLASWSRGDVKHIASTFNHDLADSPDLRHSLLEQRNANWAKWIEQRMGQPGTIMIAVGAGHLAGNQSVIALLQKDGYRVRRLQ
jgi:uncharacterized protein YbaP (TraB family)